MIEADGRWILPLVGQTLKRVCIDFAVTLLFSGGLELRIEQPFVMSSADRGDILVVPGDNSSPWPLVVSLRQHAVTKAEAYKDGDLRLEFVDGIVFGVPAAEGFEAWELSGPGGLRVVAIPGGALAVWLPDTDVRPH